MNPFTLQELNTLYYGMARLVELEQQSLKEYLVREEQSPAMTEMLTSRVVKAGLLASKIGDMIVDEIKKEQ